MFSYPKRLKYKPGDRVRIVSKWAPDSLHNREGWMDHWLGEVMTISSIVQNFGYHMYEDQNEWIWHPNMIAGLAQPQPIPTLNIYLASRKEMPSIPKPATILEEKE